MKCLRTKRQSGSIAASFVGLVAALLCALGCSGEGGTRGAGSGGQGATASSSSGGAGMGGMGGSGFGYCETASDCPGEDTACQKRACEWNQCSMAPAPPYAVAESQTKGDCKQNVCDGAGKEVVQNDDADPYDDMNDCTLDQCSAGEPLNIPLAAGASCTSNGGKKCDGEGACVECLSSTDCGSDVCVKAKCVPASCADGEKNGGETGLDCGGAACAPCIAGEPCMVGSDCTSDVCNAGVCAEPSCIDGKRNGSESDIDCGGTCLPCADGGKCAIGADCASLVCAMGLCQPPDCGDGLMQGAEGCDDGNTGQGDGCDASCAVEPGHLCVGSPSFCLPVATETEPNSSGTCSNANGPYAPPILVEGTVATGDFDYVAFTVPARADVQIAMFGPVFGQCALALGAGLILRGPQCNDARANAASLGSNECAQITPLQHVGARQLAPGTYYVSVMPPLVGSIDYQIVITLTALCGNGIREGFEECDTGGPSPTCDADCQRVPVCGDGLWEAPEVCEDGNTADGDCCSSTCQVEPGCPPVETEPNQDCASADGPFEPPFVYTGQIDPADDEDDIAFTISAYADVQIETFDPTVGQCIVADTIVELRNSKCEVLVSDDDDGPSNCSKITAFGDAQARHLVPGSYHARVRALNHSVIPKYQLAVQLTALCGNGIKEGSEACDGTPGCSAACTLCGNGILDAYETCDDQNAIDGDGCSAICAVEANYTCEGTPSVCIQWERICNDGLDNDGNGKIDGADPSCALPAYFPACQAGETLHVYKSKASLGLQVPNGNGSDVSHTLAIPDIGNVSRAALLFNVSCPYTFPTRIRLTPPGAPSIDACSSAGSSPFDSNFVDTVLDSTCPLPVQLGSGPFTGCYSPFLSFASLAGTSAEGTWTSTITYVSLFGEVATFHNWAMIFCTAP